jgi:hypothetical protein
MMDVTEGYSNSGQIVDLTPPKPEKFEPTEAEKELISFVVEHTDRWREYRDQNFMDDWDKYERVWRGKWSTDDKYRDSERSKIVSPATQQAIETRHAEIMEAIFGQGEFFDIDDDLMDQSGAIDVEQLKRKLMEDFAQDKIRKSVDQIALMAEVYGTGIGEVTVSKVKQFKPMTVPVSPTEMAYGTGESERVSVKIVPINPKNFLWDPNGTEVSDCMGVAIEKYISIHKIAEGIKEGKYRNIEIATLYESDALEPTQETRNYEDDKVKLLTYYGLFPREYLTLLDGEIADLSDDIGESEIEDYNDLIEGIVVIANGDKLLKAEESPYMMKDRPVLTYQADTVPNRLPGRGTAEKAFNMQAAIDGSMRSHMDALALTGAPMIGMDATRMPRGMKFEVKPGKAILTNGRPSEILEPFQFGQNNTLAMETSKEFERMLLMATSTVDSGGQVSQVARDSGDFNMATATLIKKYKRVLVNFQEDFLIPFIYKAAWRYMQFAPERYPAVDVKFIPTATLGVIAREYEQQQLAFLIQTLGAQSPLTPILMQSVVKNSSLSNREEMLAQLQKASQPDPQQTQVQQMAVHLEGALKQAQVKKTEAEAAKAQAEAQVTPQVAQAKLVAALSNNLNDQNESADFERRAKIAELLLKEKDLHIKAEDIASNERIATKQMEHKKQSEADYMSNAAA